ncbi:FAD-dependent oxidoreductase [Hominifimenecus sp. rT4P-3]|uniref:FAD-dependent oxidoreductase n=1 Tax=Hominifimenecus sp. rT4P-3 TaxID=3242979 RepID=UPI003DA3DE97
MDWSSIPCAGEYEVVVIGGGTAGFAAAAAAAKQKTEVLLIEEQAFLGGTATGAMVGQFLGFTGEPEISKQKGLLGELCRRLQRDGGTEGIRKIYLLGREDMDVLAMAYDVNVMRRVMDQMVRESGVHVLFHTKAIGIERDGERITSILIHNTAGIQRVRGKVFIDATFHGSIAAECGCPSACGGREGEIQPGTLMFALGGVDKKIYQSVSREENRRLAGEGVATGHLPVNTLLARPAPGTEDVMFLNMSRVPVNCLNPEDYSLAEMEAREQVDRIATFYRERVPGYQKSYIAWVAPMLGLRESRRILGQYILTGEDVLEGKKFEDAVAYSNYPVDIHDAKGLGSRLQKPKGDCFSIPYRCLIGKVPNLLVTGRCISAEYEAHAALRVCATCVQLGEAAGIASVLGISSECDVNAMDGREVKKYLFS